MICRVEREAGSLPTRQIDEPDIAADSGARRTVDTDERARAVWRQHEIPVLSTIRDGLQRLTLSIEPRQPRAASLSGRLVREDEAGCGEGADTAGTRSRNPIGNGNRIALHREPALVKPLSHECSAAKEEEMSFGEGNVTDIA